MRRATAIAAVGLIAVSAAARSAEELVTLPVREGVTESYLLVYDKSSSPKAVAVSFIGGAGAIEFVGVTGGDPAQSGPRDPLSPHGYFGREQAVASAMRNFMLGKAYAREIGKEQ